MDIQEHTELFRLQSAELAARTRFCPEDQLIAEYYDDDLPIRDRSTLERHLTDCSYCLARIGLFERLDGTRRNRRIPGSVMATAKQMVHRSQKRRRKLAPAWAAAAMLVIGLFAFFYGYEGIVQETRIDPPDSASADPYTSQLRSVKREAIQLDVLSPKPGTGVAPGSSIQWADIPGNLHYDIFVLSHAGDVLWSERTNGTEWVVSESLQLAAGNRYYFRVEALLPDGRKVSSTHLEFQIEGPE